MLSKNFSGDESYSGLQCGQQSIERSSNLVMKSSTGSGTDECDTRESSSAAMQRAVLPKSTHRLIQMLVSFSISVNLPICEQNCSLASCSFTNIATNENESRSSKPKTFKFQIHQDKPFSITPICDQASNQHDKSNYTY